MSDHLLLGTVADEDSEYALEPLGLPKISDDLRIQGLVDAEFERRLPGLVEAANAYVEKKLQPGWSEVARSHAAELFEKIAPTTERIASVLESRCDEQLRSVMKRATDTEKAHLEKLQGWAKESVREAIRNNRQKEAPFYWACILIVLGGFMLIVYSVFQSDWTSKLACAGASALASALVWPAVSQINKLRHENTSLKMIELSFATVENANQAIELLRDFFGKTFVGSERGNGKK